MLFSDKIAITQHPTSWTWPRKETETARIYGGGFDKLKSRKLEMA